jgi:UDP-glucose 4-epimerase
MLSPLRAPLLRVTERVRARNGSDVWPRRPRSSKRHRSARYRFIDLARAGAYDVLCHHAARGRDYRSPDFDVPGALQENTANLRAVLEVLAGGGLRSAVPTGSVFEQDDGAGETPLIAFSPYGLSKGLTAAVVSHRCREFGLRYGKFVIPNPFGPLDEPRFCSHLIATWRKGDVACINTPSPDISPK